jgi:hypothetical protein
MGNIHINLSVLDVLTLRVNIFGKGHDLENNMKCFNPMWLQAPSIGFSIDK